MRTMFWLFISFPFLEILFSLWVLGELGFAASFLLLIAAFMFGLSLIRLPSFSMVKSGMRFLAGALLILPGFLSDVLGLTLLVLSLLPGVEIIVSKWVTTTFQNGVVFTYGDFGNSEMYERPIRDVTPLKPNELNPVPKSSDQN